MFSSILIALCLLSGPDISNEIFVVKDNGKVNKASKIGNTKSDWTVDGRFIRNGNGKIVGFYGVDEAPGRLLR